MAPLIYIQISNLSFMDIKIRSKDEASDVDFFNARWNASLGDFTELKKLPIQEIHLDLFNRHGNLRKGIGLIADFYDYPLAFILSKCASDSLLTFLNGCYIRPVANNYSLKPEYEKFRHREEFKKEFFHVFPEIFISDIIDMDKSMIKLWDDGRPERVLKLVLKEGVITPPVFKLAEFPRGEIYFSQEFVDAYQQNNLTGVTFRDARQLRYKGSTVEKTNIPYAGDELCEKNSLFRRPHANTIGTVVGLKLFTCLNLSNSDVRNTNKRVEF